MFRGSKFRRLHFVVYPSHWSHIPRYLSTFVQQFVPLWPSDFVERWQRSTFYMNWKIKNTIRLFHIMLAKRAEGRVGKRMQRCGTDGFVRSGILAYYSNGLGKLKDSDWRRSKMLPPIWKGRACLKKWRPSGFMDNSCWEWTGALCNLIKVLFLWWDYSKNI